MKTVEPKPIFDLISDIEVNLDEEEVETIVYEWLYLTTWLNQLTEHEYKTAEDILELFFELFKKAYGINLELRDE